jgi:hypothetical protein
MIVTISREALTATVVKTITVSQCAKFAFHIEDDYDATITMGGASFKLHAGSVYVSADANFPHKIEPFSFTALCTSTTTLVLEVWN